MIIGANGSGKTRLGVHIEHEMLTKPVHRISAHKTLTLKDDIQLVSLERAQNTHLHGNADATLPQQKENIRWRGNAAVHRLEDFDGLLQHLFAENNRVALQDREVSRSNPTAPLSVSKLERLVGLWAELLPHRKLQAQESTIQVQASKSSSEPYNASQMSDGERVIFYFLGQCLLAPADSLIIIDEPEGHVHKAILGQLWDAIERTRPDCAFLYITHDLDFAVSRPAKAKYFIRSYNHNPPSWDIAEVPRDTGLPDHVVAEIVGSRKPILFVEGERGSLDAMLYRHHYPDFTILPIGSCAAVIHSVASYKGSAALHWLKAKGIVDADHRSPEEVASLLKLDVHALPVAEVENLLLLPDVFEALSEALAVDANKRLALLKKKVLEVAKAQVDAVTARYVSRWLDARLKRIANGATDLAALQANYQSEIASIDLAATFKEFKTTFDNTVASTDLAAVLKLFDNKTLLSIAAGVLGLKSTDELLERVERLLGDKEKGENLRAALASALPAMPT